MPLSEHEQRVLDELEQTLHREDPAFVQRVQSGIVSLHTRFRLALSVFGFIMCLILLLVFCVTTKVIVGVAGFVVRFLSGMPSGSTRAACIGRDRTTPLDHVGPGLNENSSGWFVSL